MGISPIACGLGAALVFDEPAGPSAPAAGPFGLTGPAAPVAPLGPVGPVAPVAPFGAAGPWTCHEPDSRSIGHTAETADAEEARGTARAGIGTTTKVTDAIDFSWDALPPVLLEGLAEAIGVEPDHAAQRLAERFGEIPNEQFVRQFATLLVDTLLSQDAPALAAVSEVLGSSTPPRRLADALLGSKKATWTAGYWLRLRGLCVVGSLYGDTVDIWPWVPREVSDPDCIVEPLQETIQSLLSVDEQWVLIDGDDWTWWPTATPISIETGPARLVFGDVGYRIRARCSLVENLRLSASEIVTRLNSINGDATLFAFVDDPSTERIDICCAYTAHSGNEALHRLFASALILMAKASTHVDELARYFEGEPIRVPHPPSGLRGDHDELAEMDVEAVERQRAEPSPFVEALAHLSFEQWPGCALQFSARDPGKLQAELAFKHDIPALPATQLGWELGTSLVQFDGTVAREGLGRGLEGTLQIPNLDLGDPQLEESVAPLLNRIEAYCDTWFAYFGAWSATSDDGRAYDLTFRGYVPAAFNYGDLPGFSAWTMWERNRWLSAWYESQVLA